MNQPRLRFKEFKGEWEEKQLNRIGNLKSGFGFPENEQGNNHGIPFFKVSDMNDNYVIMHKSNNYVSLNQIKKNNWKVINSLNNAIIFAKVGAALLKNRKRLVMNPFLIDNNMMSYSFDKSWDTFFGLYLFNVIYLPKYSQVGAIPSFNAQDIGLINVNLPYYQEQQKIGQFFQNLDQQIELQSDKLEHLKQAKQGYLQKMLPKEKFNIPRLRFINFYYNWMKKSFQSLLIEKDGIRRGPFGSSIKKSDFIPSSPYVVYEQQNAIYNRFNTRYNISKYKYEELKKFHLKSGDFIMSGAGTIGKIARIPIEHNLGVFNQALIRLRLDNHTDSDFFIQFMRSNFMQKKITENNPGSAMQNLRPMKEIKSIDVLIPSLPEQHLIGQFFSKLDRLIDLQQQKVDHLKRQKQAYLQKMFV